MGLGLIGGSYAAALREKGFEVGGDRSGRQCAIDFALENGFISSGRTQPDAEYLCKFDIVGARAVSACADSVAGGKRRIPSSRRVCNGRNRRKERHRRARAGAYYPPEWNLWARIRWRGARSSGVQNATTPDLFCGANYIVTPTEKNTPEGDSALRGAGPGDRRGLRSAGSPRASTTR